MKNRFLRLVRLSLIVGILSAILSTMFTVPAHAEQLLNVHLTDKNEGVPTVNFTNEHLATPGGAQQLTWWYPNHSVKISPKAINKAPYIKVKYTRCAVQSKSIAKQAKGAPIVVAKAGSKICNTGKNGKIVGGFPWTVNKGPAVLKWNTKLKLYEHALDLLKPNKVPADATIVIKRMKFHSEVYTAVLQCFNRLGGKVNKMYTKVIQVRWTRDLLYNADVHAEAHTGLVARVTGSCPGGFAVDIFLTVGGSASANASISYTEHERGTIQSKTKKAYENNTSLVASATADAESTLDATVKLVCGDTPSTPNSPSVSAYASACVKEGEQTGVINVLVGNPQDSADTATTTVTPQSQTKTSPVAANDSVTQVFNGYGPGTYTVRTTLNNANKSATTTVTVNKCDSPQAPPPDVNLNTMNQVIETKKTTTDLGVTVYGGNTATVTISTLWGEITTTKTFNNVSGSWSTTIGYTAPGEIPDGSQSFPNTPAPPVGSDQVRVVVVDNVTGERVVAITTVKITPFIPAP